MPNKYQANWKLQEVTDEGVYDAIRYLEPKSRNRNKYTDWKLREITDEEVCEAIRYLDPEPSSEDESDCSTAVAICLSVGILLFGFLAYICLYP